MMKLLLVAPIISIVIGIIVGLCVGAKRGGGGVTTVSWEPYLPDGEEYKNRPREKDEWPSLADQLDGRITNIFKNPWKGVL